MGEISGREKMSLTLVALITMVVIMPPLQMPKKNHWNHPGGSAKRCSPRIHAGIIKIEGQPAIAQGHLEEPQSSMGPWLSVPGLKHFFSTPPSALPFIVEFSLITPCPPRSYPTFFLLSCSSSEKRREVRSSPASSSLLAPNIQLGKNIYPLSHNAVQGRHRTPQRTRPPANSKGRTSIIVAD